MSKEDAKPRSGSGDAAARPQKKDKAKGPKASQQVGAGGGSGDAIAQRLAELGERFMSQFDDADDERPRPKKKQNVSTTAAAAAPAAAAGRGSQPAGPGPSSGKAQQPQPQLQRQQPQPQQPQAQRPPAQARARPGPAPLAPGKGKAGGGGGGSGGASGKKGRAAAEIDAILDAGFLAAAQKAQAPGRPSVSASASGPGALPPPQSPPDLRRERKLFMSHKASMVHDTPYAASGGLPPQQHQRGGRQRPSSSLSAAGQGGAGGGGGGAEGGDEVNFSALSPAEFQQLQLEVERLGAGGLDKKAAKAYRARMLERLGARADKAPRTAASIGKGVARMAAVRSERALQEAIAAGMVRAKGLGKKKKRQAEARGGAGSKRDGGLMELGGGFRGGVLRLPKAKAGKVYTGVRPSTLKLPKSF